MAGTPAIIKKLIRDAAADITAETGAAATPSIKKLKWPIACTVGPGLEGAIACETRIGYVNGSQGRLIYRGYDISDLCIHSTFEEVCYLLLNGSLPSSTQLRAFKQKLVRFSRIPNTLRKLMSFQAEEMHPMAALRLGSDFLRQRVTWRDRNSAPTYPTDAIAADEDSIPMETEPRGEKHAIYEFRTRRRPRPPDVSKITTDATRMDDCLRLIASMSTLCAAIRRLREDKLPIEPDPDLGHAANFLYMMTGKKPTTEEAKIMDICLILHADHGMNAGSFAALVVASTLSDVYFSVGAGIAALNGPLHGGANEEVIRLLERIGSPDGVEPWFKRAMKEKQKIMGFGHRVYKTYDPRARILGPLAKFLVDKKPEVKELYRTAAKLERTVVSHLGKTKGIYPNVDFYSGLVYRCLDIPSEMFTPVFAVSRVAGWTARVTEYLHHNRIFRPRSIYVGDFDRPYVPLSKRDD